MKRSFFIMCLYFLFGCCFNPIMLFAQPVNYNFSSQDKAAASSTQYFGLNLLRSLSGSDSSHNIFISPLSVSTAFGMTLNGAAGNTYSEIKNTLQLSDVTQDGINESFLKIGNALSASDSSFTFSDANSIWIRPDAKIEKRFLNIDKDYFNAEIRSLLSPGEINEWVNLKTHGKIPEIVKDIARDAVMFLINAIYFKAVWKQKFNPKSTHENTFHLTGGGEAKCKLMQQENNYDYYKGADFAALEIPYSRDNIVMLVILPDEGIDINNFLDEFENTSFKNILSGMQNQKVILKLPRFEMEYTISLPGTLKRLGISDAFDSSKAEFPNICRNDKLFISEVLHKTFIKVGEENTEAAAVTKIKMSGTTTAWLPPPPPPIPFIVDRPFLFLILDKESGSCLFTGKIVNPALK